MAVEAPQYTEFIEQVVKKGTVFTFAENNDFLFYSVHDIEMIPFWSSRSHLEKIQTELPKYQNYHIKELNYEQFCNWLPKLGKQGVHVGVNWSGRNLIGYNVTARVLIKSLNSYKKELGI